MCYRLKWHRVTVTTFPPFCRQLHIDVGGFGWNDNESVAQKQWEQPKCECYAHICLFVGCKRREYIWESMPEANIACKKILFDVACRLVAVTPAAAVSANVMWILFTSHLRWIYTILRMWRPFIMGFGSGCACIRLISGNMSAIRRCEVAAHMWRICTSRAACLFFADDRSVHVKVCSSAILHTINIFRHSLQDHNRVNVVAQAPWISVCAPYARLQLTSGAYMRKCNIAISDYLSM